MTEKEECQRQKKCRGKGQTEKNDNDREKRTGSCEKRSGNGRQRWVTMAGLEMRGNGGDGGEWQWIGKRRGNCRERLVAMAR